MAYVDQKMSTSRIVAIIFVALLHALLGYAFITGLAYNVLKKAGVDLKTFDVNEKPPPPEDKPPPPKQEKQVQPPPVVSPPPIVRVNTMPPIIQTQRVAPPPVVTPTAPPAPPAPVAAPPPPPPPAKVEPAHSKGSLAGLISTDDYPSDALRNQQTGTVRVRLDVSSGGRVTGCSVVSSSGVPSLDSATCRLLTSRARFTPARDSNGNPTSDTVTSPAIVWRIQEQ